jgi:tRNA threonylcarbamoyladenosine biosynthesis protein TsaB
MSRILTIDTSTTACSAAVMDDGNLAAEFIANARSINSSGVLRCVASVMECAGMTADSLDAFGVALGPGSFTGLRVGIATVKGLAMATGRPTVGFSSLAMLAMNLPHAAFPVCPMLDARKSEVYTALYRCRSLPEAIIQDCVTAPADFLELIREPTLFLGSGAVRYRDLITARLDDLAIFAPSVCHAPRASSGVILAQDLFSRGEVIPQREMIPGYIRPSEAELARLKMQNAT